MSHLIRDDAMFAAPGETLRYTVSVPRNQPPGLYWYHTHQHMESYRQDLDGMSGAIVVEGIDRYVPELRHMEERIMVLRDAELEEQGPQRSALMHKVSLEAQGCGSSTEQPERKFTSWCVPAMASGYSSRNSTATS